MKRSVLLFQPGFVELIRRREKTTTLRARAHCNSRDILSLRYWKDKPYRSPQVPFAKARAVGVRPYTLSIQTVSDEVAKRGGFSGWGEMLAFFEGKLPFQGELIEFEVLEFFP